MEEDLKKNRKMTSNKIKIDLKNKIKYNLKNNFKKSTLIGCDIIVNYSSFHLVTGRVFFRVDPLYIGFYCIFKL
jgi:hypothetical protein